MKPERCITVAAPALTSVRLCPVGCQCVKTPGKPSRYSVPLQRARQPRRDWLAERPCPRACDGGGSHCWCRGDGPPRGGRLVCLRTSQRQPGTVLLGSCLYPGPPARLLGLALRGGSVPLPRLPVDQGRRAGGPVVRP